MKKQTLDESLPEDLTQAIDAISALEAPADAVQRVINRSANMSVPSSPVVTPLRNKYLMWACYALAFLSPLFFYILKNQLNVIPGWELPIVKVVIVALVTLGFVVLAWSFGRRSFGTTQKQSAPKTRWLANLATLVVLGLVLSGLLGNSNNLYAQMQKTLAKIKTIQYVMTMSDVKTGKPVGGTIRAYMHEPHLIRSEVETEFEEVGNLAIIVDLKRKLSLEIDSANKTAELLPLYEIDEMKNRYKQAISELRSVDSESKLLGESTVNGRLCVDFEIFTDGVASVVSIDKETKLPVQMKSTVGEENPITAVIDQFVFDEPLDPKLFSLEPPEGYTTTVVERKAPTNDSAIELLPGEHFGAAKFGMSTEQVTEALGKPDKVSDWEGSFSFELNPDELPEDLAPEELLKTHQCRKLGYRSRGFKLTVDKEQGLIAVQCLGSAMGGRSFQGQIAGGIKMGDSPDDVRSLLGEPFRKANINAGEPPNDVVYKTENNSTIKFTFYDSKLIMVINRKTD